MLKRIQICTIVFYMFFFMLSFTNLIFVQFRVSVFPTWLHMGQYLWGSIAGVLLIVLLLRRGIYWESVIIKVTVFLTAIRAVVCVIDAIEGLFANPLLFTTGLSPILFIILCMVFRYIVLYDIIQPVKEE